MPPTDPARPLPFQPFYVAHRAAVLRLVVGMVGVGAGEDCVQEAWLKVLRAWPPRDDTGRLDSWVLTIAHRTALDHLRRAGRELASGTASEVDPTASVEEQLPQLGPTALRDALGGLSERQRAVVLLRVVLDRSHADVAAVLDTSPEAARRTYADAIAALRSRLEAST